MFYLIDGELPVGVWHDDAVVLGSHVALGGHGDDIIFRVWVRQCHGDDVLVQVDVWVT